MKQVRPSLADITARLVVLGTDSIDQPFAHMLKHYTCTQQKNPFKTLYRGTSVNHINVNDVKGNDNYYTHCQSKMIEHSIFWHFVDQSRNSTLKLRPYME